MIKLQVKNEIDTYWFNQHPEILEHVKRELMFNIANKMNEVDCFDIKETSCGEHVEFNLTGFVLEPKEFNEILDLVKIIKDSLPTHMINYGNRLFDLLTKETI